MYATTMPSRNRERSPSNRKMAVLIPNSHVTALVNGGKLNVIGSPVRRTELPLVHFYSFDARRNLGDNLIPGTPTSDSQPALFSDSNARVVAPASRRLSRGRLARAADQHSKAHSSQPPHAAAGEDARRDSRRDGGATKCATTQVGSSSGIGNV
jgi:hypothetical protein